MHSLELGYRRLWMEGRLMLAADVYYNLYRNFLAQIEASVPLTTIASDIPAALYDRSKQSRYRLWTNSRSVVHNYGVEMDWRIMLSKKFNANANASYQALKKTSKDDGLEDGYNTPAWVINANITGTNVIGRASFVVGIKHQSQYYWQSFLNNGNVPSMTLFNASAQHPFPKAGILLTVGASKFSTNTITPFLAGR